MWSRALLIFHRRISLHSKLNFYNSLLGKKIFDREHRSRGLRNYFDGSPWSNFCKLYEGVNHDIVEKNSLKHSLRNYFDGSPWSNFCKLYIGVNHDMIEKNSLIWEKIVLGITLMGHHDLIFSGADKAPRLISVLKNSLIWEK